MDAINKRVDHMDYSTRVCRMILKLVETFAFVVLAWYNFDFYRNIEKDIPCWSSSDENDHVKSDFVGAVNVADRFATLLKLYAIIFLIDAFRELCGVIYYWF
jgi:hypothetical protein